MPNLKRIDIGRRILQIYTALMITFDIYSIMAYNIQNESELFFTTWGRHLRCICFLLILINPHSVLEWPIFLLCFGVTWSIALGITVVLAHDSAIFDQAVSQYGKLIAHTGNFIEHGLPCPFFTHSTWIRNIDTCPPWQSRILWLGCSWPFLCHFSFSLVSALGQHDRPLSHFNVLLF